MLNHSCLFEKGNKLFDDYVKLLENMPKQMTPYSTFYKIHILVSVRLALPIPACSFLFLAQPFFSVRLSPLYAAYKTPCGCVILIPLFMGPDIW